jgi:monofunctional glycosyltransferase
VRRLLAFFVKCSVVATAALVFVVWVLASVPPPTTAFVLEARFGEDGHAVAYDWEPAARISPWLRVAVVAGEDQRFAEHHGFDFAAIENAASHNRHGGSVRGASTISQQVAKNLFLWPGRSYLRKGVEAVVTVLLEKLWTKQRILEVYVNIAEMGDGVFGAEAASRRFFDKPAAELTREEAALLAAALPDPHTRRVDHPSAELRHRQRWILGQMDALGGLAWLGRLGEKRSVSASRPGSGSP